MNGNIPFTRKAFLVIIKRKGGVIIVSAAIAALTKRKPAKKEIWAVCLSFIGILALVFIPI